MYFATLREIKAPQLSFAQRHKDKSKAAKALPVGQSPHKSAIIIDFSEQYYLVKHLNEMKGFSY
jgi:hypothetical protein